MLYVAFAIAAMIFLAPYYWLGTNAFKTQEQIFTLPPQLVPTDPTLQNFRDAFAQSGLLRAFLNSTLIAIGHVVLALFLTSLAGYAFAKYRSAPGNNALFLVVLGTMMIPGAVTTIPVFVVMANLGLVNSYWAMIIPGAASAFGIFWMRQYITANVPDDLLAAARIDGCGEFGIYWRIVLPVIVPALGALGILLLISTWNNLMWALLMMRTDNMQTLPLLIYLLSGEQRTPYGLVMASGVLATLPLVIAFLMFQRSFISGITAGSIKS
jgi:ABC-type glycerol-3-phosphate transport system permease component